MAARRPLTRRRIVQAALAIGDREGLDAVTMRKVAAKLGVEAMTLYHHVPNKEAVVEGMIDLLVEQAKLPTGELTPEEWIRGAADAIRTLARTHPRTFSLLMTRPVPMADAVVARPFEDALAAFVRAGSSVADAYHAVQSIGVAVIALAASDAAAMLDHADEHISHVDQLDPGSFPLMAAILAAEDVDLDRLWRVAVDGLVHGHAG